MRHRFTALSVFGSFVSAAGGIKPAELVPGSWCVTYLSTYLAPISTAGAAPNTSALDSLGPVLTSSTLTVDTELLPAATGSGRSSIASDVTVLDRSSFSIPASDLPSVTSDTRASETSTGPGLSGRQVIFLITPSGDVSKRELRGFVGNSNPQVCTFASVFTLGSGLTSGELFDGDVPLYYQGEDYKEFQGLGSPTIGAITRTFASEGGTLQFKNPSLPKGQATFCQDSSSGLVYMVFTSGPPNCTPVQLSIYGVERCVDGRLVGLNESSTSTASSQATQSASISVIDEEEETASSTLSLTPDTSLIPDTSSIAETDSTTRTTDSLSRNTELVESLSEQSTLAESPESSSIGLSTESSSALQSLSEEISSTRLSTESSSALQSLSEEISSTRLSTESSSSLQSQSEETSSKAETSLDSTTLPETEVTVTSSSADVPSSTSIESLESSDPQTSAEPPTTTGSPTTSELETTTSTEEQWVITNSFSGGRFADGLGDLETVGDVTHQVGGCFKGDGSPDDGCAAMRADAGAAAPEERLKAKRALGSFAGMSQWLGFLRPSTKVLYTVQFYYAVVSYGGGMNLCTVEAYLGNRYFYFNDHFVLGMGATWTRVLTTVAADSQRGIFGISMDCWGTGYAELYVDSIFISNQITPQNIDRFQLNFDDSPNNPSSGSTRSSSSSSKPSPTSQPTLSTPGWMPTVSLDEESFSTPGTTKRSSSTVNSLVTTLSEHTPLYTPSESWNTPSYSGRTHNSSSSLAQTWNTPVKSPSTIHTPIDSWSTPDTWHTPTRNPPSPTTGQPPRSAIASQPVCPDGWRYPGHCGQAWPTPAAPICERRGWPEARYYQYTLEQEPLQALEIQSCAITCAYMDDCFSFSVNPDDPNSPCFFLKQRLGEVPFPEPTPGLEGNLEWSDIDCFNCFLCGQMPSSSSWLPAPSTLDGGEHSTPTTPRGPATSNQGGHNTPGPVVDPTTDNNWEHSTPTPSRRPTTTSQAPGSSTSTCRYTHGELCQYNHQNGLLCSYAAKYNGETWTESRNDYPHQDRYEQCAAICQTLDGCQSTGYNMNENRCLFTGATLTVEDMSIFDESPWKHSLWTDKRCWTCPDCIPESVLNVPSQFCSYTHGDVCSRVGVSEDIICNLPAYMAGGYWTGDEWIEQYPLQRSNEECAAICRAIEGCKGSGWKDGRCMLSVVKLSLHPDDLIPLQTNDPSLFNAVWDDPACFNCPGCYQLDD